MISNTHYSSTSNFEVDFVLADTTAIQVKGKDPVGERDLRGIRILPWKDFIERLWDGGFV